MKSLEEILERRVMDIHAGCKTVTMIPGRMMQTFNRLSFRRLIVDIVHDFLYKPQDVPIDVINFFKFAYQTAKVGFADDDIWNLTDTLREIIKPRLRAFKEMKRTRFRASLSPMTRRKPITKKQKRSGKRFLIRCFMLSSMGVMTRKCLITSVFRKASNCLVSTLAHCGISNVRRQTLFSCGN